MLVVAEAVSQKTCLSMVFRCFGCQASGASSLLFRTDAPTQR
jgi:hypothetical protein